MRSKPSKSNLTPKRVVIYLPTDLSRKLTEACKAEGQTVSSWARLAAEEKVRRASQTRKL